MNYAQILSLSLIVVSSVSADNIRLLNSAEINKKAVAIGRKAFRDTCCFNAIAALGYAQNVYALVQFFTQQPEIVPSCAECKEAARIIDEKNKNISFVESVKLFPRSLSSSVKNFGNSTKNLLTTPQGWWSIGQGCFYYGGQLSALFFMGKIAETLNHPDTLRWYAHTYVPYESTITLMKDAIMQLQNQSLESDQVRHNKQIVNSSVNRLARHGESLCAYIAYKSTKLDEHEQLLAERSARYLFKYHNDWLMRISMECESKSPDYNEINMLIAAYETEIAAQLRHFSAVEGETKAERRAMRERLE